MEDGRDCGWEGFNVHMNLQEGIVEEGEKESMRGNNAPAWFAAGWATDLTPFHYLLRYPPKIEQAA